MVSSVILPVKVGTPAVGTLDPGLVYPLGPLGPLGPGEPCGPGGPGGPPPPEGPGGP